MKISNEYAAGFFDADGAVYAARRTSRKGNSSPTLLVCCTQAEREPGVCPEVLVRHHSQWGGSIAKKKMSAKNRRDQWQWVLAPKNAVDFLIDILPYTIVKTAVIQKSLEFAQLQSLPLRQRINTKTKCVRPEHAERVWRVHAEICELNKRGQPFNALRKWDKCA